MRVLTCNEMQQIKGRELVTLTGVLLYVAVAAGAAAVIKVLTSSSGRVSIPGVTMSWN